MHEAQAAACMRHKLFKQPIACALSHLGLHCTWNAEYLSKTKKRCGHMHVAPASFWIFFACTLSYLQHNCTQNKEDAELF